MLQGETQESRKGTDQVDSDDVEIKQPQRKEQTGMHFMYECCQNSGERFYSLVFPVLFCFVLINEHFFNIFFLPSELSVETQSQNNSVQSEGQPCKSSEYRAITKNYLSGAPVYTVKIKIIYYWCLTFQTR